MRAFVPSAIFYNLRVDATSVEDFCRRFYGLDTDSSASLRLLDGVICFQKNRFFVDGFVVIASDVSVTGRVVSYYGPLAASFEIFRSFSVEADSVRNFVDTRFNKYSIKNPDVYDAVLYDLSRAFSTYGVAVISEYHTRNGNPAAYYG